MDGPLSFQKILWAFFAFIGGMIALRYFFSGERYFIFLIWNLFLAWIPFALSIKFKGLHKSKLRIQVVVFFIWFIFLPNALYIITDLIHLDLESLVPKWYDALLLFSSAILSLLMAFISLLRVEKFLICRFKMRFVNVIMFAILFVASFGVYLGRFLRWNSWDVVSNPIRLFVSIAERCLFPFRYLHTWGVTVMFTILFYLLYLMAKKMPGYINRAS